MQSCWLACPGDRPSFTDISNRLEAFMTIDKPYVELLNIITQGDDGYTVPIVDSDSSETHIAEARVENGVRLESCAKTRETNV